MSEDDKQAILRAFEDKTALILEELDRKFAIFLENNGVLIDKKLAPVADDISELKTDMKTVKAAVTDTNHQVQNHEKRINRLEAKPA